MDEGAVLLISLVVRLVFAVATAAVASSKGRSAVGWFFCGFFFALIGLIIVACLPNLIEKRRREEQIDRENRRLREQLAQEQIKNEAFRRHASARLDMHDVQIGVDTRAAVPALPVMPQSGPPLIGHDAPQIPHADNPAWPGTAGNGVPATNGATHFGPPVADPFGYPNAEGMVPVNGDGQGYNVAPPPPPRQAAAPSVTPAREWHYEHQGETRGPVSDRQLVALAKTGEVTADTLLWTEQLGDWKPAGQIKPLQPHLRS